eukprot:10234588-Alexandrium_andersonii.AAC.1
MSAAAVLWPAEPKATWIALEAPRKSSNSKFLAQPLERPSTLSSMPSLRAQASNHRLSGVALAASSWTTRSARAPNPVRSSQ